MRTPQALNGELHGPVHLMIGGHWNYKTYWGETRATAWPSFGDVHLLLSKFLWRQGYVRVPELCSSDTAGEDCMPSCPSGVKNGRSARELLEASGVLGKAEWADYMNKTLYLEGGGHHTDEELLDELCHVGYPGEMFTSSAPQDPTFWPLHGNAERYVQALRYYKSEGLISFDETWDYDHGGGAASDTRRICDWSGVEAGTYDMPTCTEGVCSGHKVDDVLPFFGFEWVDGMKNAKKLYTNAEFYDLVSYTNKNLPYVYDSTTYWAGCTGKSMYTTYETFDA